MAINIAELAVSVSTNGTGTATANELSQVEQTGQNAAVGMEKAAAGASRLEHGMASMAGRAAGANAEMASLAASMLRVAGAAAGPVIGAAAAIGILAFAFKEYQDQIKADIKAQDEMVTSLDKLGTHAKIVANNIKVAKLQSELTEGPSLAEKAQMAIAAQIPGAPSITDMIEAWAQPLRAQIAAIQTENAGLEQKYAQETAKRTQDAVHQMSEAEHKAAEEKLKNFDQGMELRKQELEDIIKNGDANSKAYKDAQQALALIIGQHVKLQALAQGYSEAMANALGLEAQKRSLEKTAPDNDDSSTIKEAQRAAEALKRQQIRDQEEQERLLREHNQRMLTITDTFTQSLSHAISQGFSNAFSGQPIGKVVAKFAIEVITALVTANQKVNAAQDALTSTQRAKDAAVAAKTAASTAASAAGTGAAGAAAASAAPLLSNPVTAGIGMLIISTALATLSSLFSGGGAFSNSGGGSSSSPTVPSTINTTSTFNPANTDRASALQVQQPVTNNFTVIGPNDPQAQRQIAKLVANAQSRGY